MLNDDDHDSKTLFWTVKVIMQKNTNNKKNFLFFLHNNKVVLTVQDKLTFDESVNANKLLHAEIER